MHTQTEHAMNLFLPPTSKHVTRTHSCTCKHYYYPHTHHKLIHTNNLPWLHAYTPSLLPLFFLSLSTIRYNLDLWLGVHELSHRICDVILPILKLKKNCSYTRSPPKICSMFGSKCRRKSLCNVCKSGFDEQLDASWHQSSEMHA